MATIRDIHNPWRDALLPASFRSALFHVETGSKENARRVVVHEFPKRDIPYAEDMGRNPKGYTVRGYCICYPFDVGGTLYRRDYRIARDELLYALEQDGPGWLQLPSLPPEYVACPKYTLTEEEKFGGYCTFDMQFVEFGEKPGSGGSDGRSAIMLQSQGLRDVLMGALSPAGLRQLARVQPQASQRIASAGTVNPPQQVQRILP